MADMDIVGTIYYFAPEVVEHNTFSFNSDIYALGASLVNLACGYPPFYDKSTSYIHVSK